MANMFVSSHGFYSKTSFPNPSHHSPCHTHIHAHAHMNAHSSFDYNNPSVEMTQMYINVRMDYMWYIHMMEYYSTTKRNDLNT